MKLPILTKNEKIFIFSAFIITVIFWGGFVGYYLIKLNRIVNSETKPIDTSAYRLPASSPTLSPTQQPKQKPTLARFTDSEYNFSFIYPPEMQVVNYGARDAVVGWALQDNRSNLLMEISLTKSTLTDINQRFPNLSFISFSQANLEGVISSFWSDKEETLFYFFPSDSNNLPYSIWIIARLNKFDPALNLTHFQKQTIIEQIIETIALET